MINNILLKFLGLRNFCETTQENETQSMPWQKTKTKYQIFFLELI